MVSKNTRKRCKICSKLTTMTTGNFLLTLNIFYTFFNVSFVDPEQVNVCGISSFGVFFQNFTYHYSHENFYVAITVILFIRLVLHENLSFLKKYFIFLEQNYCFYIHLPPMYFSFYLFDHLFVCYYCFILSRVLFTAINNVLLECSYVPT